MLGKAFVVCLMALAAQANAGLINFSGTFSGTNRVVIPAVTSISGSFSFLFDDAAVTGDFEDFTLSLVSFSLSPDPLGGTTFDTSNSGVKLTYFRGVLIQVMVGGVVSGVSELNGLGGTDDFFAYWNEGGEAVTGVHWSLATSPFIAMSNGSGSFTMTPVTSVPEPGTLALFGSGMLGLILLRFRRRTA